MPEPKAVCNCCGDCCDPINLAPGQLARMHEYGRWYAEGGRYNPDDDVFAEDRAEKGRDRVVAGLERHVVDCLFVFEHWTLIGPAEPRFEGDVQGEYVACDRFDAESRLCTAHDDRPPVCQDFPWYGQEPTAQKATTLSERCSYREDVPVTIGTKRGAFL